MQKWLRNSAKAALLAAGFTVLGAGAAYGDTTSGDSSLFGGNQAKALISAPVNVSGNSAAVLGKAESTSEGAGATVRNDRSGNGDITSGDDSVGGGNQAKLPISAPVNVCGNTAAVLGDGKATCKSGARVVNGSGRRSSADSTSGKGLALGGNQIKVPIKAPANVCGNAAGVAGTAKAACPDSAPAADPRTPSAHSPAGTYTHSPRPTLLPSKMPSRQAADELPFTGGPISTLVTVALTSLGAGAATLLAVRRRRRTHAR